MKTLCVSLLGAMLCLCVACSEEADNPGEAAADIDMGMVDMSDVGADVLEDEEEADIEPEGPCGGIGHEENGVCVADLTWSDGPALPVARDHHSTHLLVEGDDAWVMVFGGARDSGVELRQDVLSAKVQDDGSLGEWVDSGQIPLPSSGHVVTVWRSWAWVIGGIVSTEDSFTFHDKAYRCDLDRSTATLGDCVEAPGLESQKWHHQMFVRGRYIYDLGGVSFSDRRNNLVRRAVIGDNGEVGEWRLMTSMPMSLSHHGLAHTEDSVYVVGGLTSEGATDKVWRADFTEDGSIEEWIEQAPLDEPRITPAVAVVGDWLFGVSGLNDNPDPDVAFLRTSVKSALAPDGSVVGWEDAGVELAREQSHVHQVPVWNNHFYVIGGRTAEAMGNSFLSTPAVSIGTVQ